MDISHINPGAHADQEEIAIGDGQFKRIPLVAKGQSITAAARKLARGVQIGDAQIRVPEHEAMAIATAVVDPTQIRLDVDRGRVHLRRTPSGHNLVCLETRVWSAGVSADGANGRGRLESRLAGEAVWPLPHDGDGPVMRYVTRNIDRMREAVRATAKRIASPDMRARLIEHPHGVWNPIYVVAARVTVHPDPAAEPEYESSFLHTAEGSTRVVTCLGKVGIERDLPVAMAGDTANLVRRVRAGLAGRLVISPDSEEVQQAIKCATMPANVVIGVIAPDGTESTRPFHETVAEFVESIHEEPRPWTPIAQGGVRGERLVLDLAAAGLLSEEQAADATERDDHHQVTTPPDVIAGRLLRAAGHPDAHEIVRQAILEDPSRQNLSRKRFAQTVGPLLLATYRGVVGRHKSATTALANDFLPSVLRDRRDWSVREDATVREVLDEALNELERNPGKVSVAACELAARSIGALAALGLVYSDQGSAVPASWLRGSVAQVLTGLMRTAGGLKTLCEAAERAENSSLLMPTRYQPDGDPVLGEDGRAEHLHPEHGANVKVREIAFHDERPEDGDSERKDELSPYDRFVDHQRRLTMLTANLGDLLDEILEMQDADGQLLVDRHKLDRAIVGQIPERLNDVRDFVLVTLAPEHDADDIDDELDDDAEAGVIGDAFAGDGDGDVAEAA